MYKREVIYVDQDGDELSVISSTEEDRGRAPLITITHLKNMSSESIRLDEDDIRSFMESLGAAFGYSVYKNHLSTKYFTERTTGYDIPTGGRGG